jgi:hypothetical protein
VQTINNETLFYLSVCLRKARGRLCIGKTTVDPYCVRFETGSLKGKTEDLCGSLFTRREVLPYTPDAWIKEDATRVGYEISFTRHFYKPQPLRTLEEISADILAIEKEAEGLLDALLKLGDK